MSDTPPPVTPGAADEEKPKETIIRITKPQTPRFIQPQPRGSSCCPSR